MNINRENFIRHIVNFVQRTYEGRQFLEEHYNRRLNKVEFGKFLERLEHWYIKQWVCCVYPKYVYSERSELDPEPPAFKYEDYNDEVKDYINSDIYSDLWYNINKNIPIEEDLFQPVNPCCKVIRLEVKILIDSIGVDDILGLFKLRLKISPNIDNICWMILGMKKPEPVHTYGRHRRDHRTQWWR